MVDGDTGIGPVILASWVDTRGAHQKCDECSGCWELEVYVTGRVTLANPDHEGFDLTATVVEALASALSDSLAGRRAEGLGSRVLDLFGMYVSPIGRCHCRKDSVHVVVEPPEFGQTDEEILEELESEFDDEEWVEPETLTLSLTVDAARALAMALRLDREFAQGWAANPDIDYWSDQFRAALPTCRVLTVEG